MIDYIINKNIIFLQNNGIKMENSDDKAVYKYGLQILYYYIIDIFVIFSLALCFGRLYETAIMTVVFGLFQVFGGGYHAKTPLKCLAAMIFGAVIGNIFIILIADNHLVIVILAVVDSCVILILPPVTNKKHPVSKRVRQRSKLIIRMIALMIIVTTLILSYAGRNTEVAVIAVTLGLYMISWGTVKIEAKINKASQ